MTEKRWKGQERRVARVLDAKRNPKDGSASPDAESKLLVIENKDRRTFPQWMLAALAKARNKAGSKRVGVLTLTSPETPQILMVLDARDFQKWFGR